jgi:hypothetical protein
MEGSAYLSTLETLDDLDLALGQFSSSVQDLLAAANAEAAGAEAWVQSRVSCWQRQVEQAEQQLRRAQVALEMCLRESSRDRDGGYRAPDCRGQECDLMEAEARLHETRMNLETAQRWRLRIEAEVAEYHRHARRLQELAAAHTPRTRAFLGRVRAGVESYLAESAPGGTPSADIPILSGLAQALVAPLPGESSGHGESTVTASTGSGEWADRGIQLMLVVGLPDPVGIESEADFEARCTDARDALHKLQVIQPLVGTGEGASSEYWAAYDREHGLDYARGYQRAYEVFYGSRAIEVGWDGSQYDIPSGRHRVWMAKQMGIKHLPARLKVRL